MGKLAERLNDASRSGVYRTSAAAPVADAVRGTELDLVRIDAAEAPLDALASALAFPAWYGRNWDALEDCLGDLSWRPAAGHVLVFDRYPAGDELGILLDVLRASAEYWTGRSRPFFAVFVDPRRSLALPDLFRGA